MWRHDRAVLGPHESPRDQFGLEELADIIFTYDPLRHLCYPCGYLLEGTPAIDLLCDAVEQLTELDKLAIPLDKPLPICKAGALSRREVEPGSKQGPLGYLGSTRLLPTLQS